MYKIQNKTKTSDRLTIKKRKKTHLPVKDYVDRTDENFPSAIKGEKISKKIDKLYEIVKILSYSYSTHTPLET